MLAQVDTGQLAPVIAWAVGLVALFGPGARGITWIVDRIRDTVSFGDDPRFKLLWPAVALVIALASCLLFEINVVGAVLADVPRFATSSALSGVWGQIVTAIGIAGFSSSWHDRDKAKNPPLRTP